METNTNRTLRILTAWTISSTLVLIALVAKISFSDEPVRVEDPVQVDVRPTRFEYMVDSIPDLQWGSKAQELGEEGWELVFARRARDEGDNFLYECIFQRQVRS